MVLKNRRLTIRDLADSAGISFGSAQTIWIHTASFRVFIGRPRTRLISFRSQRIRLIWLRATSNYSANSKSQFGYAVSIKSESKKVLKAIPEKDYSNCFENWKKRWQKYVGLEDDYFEGDENVLAE